MHILQMQMLPYLGNQQQCSKNQKNKIYIFAFLFSRFLFNGNVFQVPFYKWRQILL